jgi:RNA polymerase sigma-70 factor (ECF subfamily)
MEKTDLQLIEECTYSTNYQKNGRDSFNILVKRHVNSVYLFIFKLIGNKEDAEDITQETFIKVWQKLSKFDMNKNFKTWLFSIAKNTAIDKLRKKRSINFTSLDTDETEVLDGGSNFESNLADTEPLPDEIFAKKESTDALLKALAQLSDNQKLIIHLHITEDLTYEEISEIIGSPMNTVKGQFRRSILKLKNILEA